MSALRGSLSPSLCHSSPYLPAALLPPRRAGRRTGGGRTDGGEAAYVGMWDATDMHRYANPSPNHHPPRTRQLLTGSSSSGWSRAEGAPPHLVLLPRLAAWYSRFQITITAYCTHIHSPPPRGREDAAGTGQIDIGGLWRDVCKGKGRICRQTQTM